MHWSPVCCPFDFSWWICADCLDNLGCFSVMVEKGIHLQGLEVGRNGICTSHTCAPCCCPCPLWFTASVQKGQLCIPSITTESYLKQHRSAGRGKKHSFTRERECRGCFCILKVCPSLIGCRQSIHHHPTVCLSGWIKGGFLGEEYGVNWVEEESMEAKHVMPKVSIMVYEPSLSKKAGHPAAQVGQNSHVEMALEWMT